MDTIMEEGGDLVGLMHILNKIKMSCLMYVMFLFYKNLQAIFVT